MGLKRVSRKGDNRLTGLRVNDVIKNTIVSNYTVDKIMFILANERIEIGDRGKLQC